MCDFPASRQAPRSHIRAFTLIELLTVIAIIGVLAAILIPVAGMMRVKSYSAKSASNLRQLGIALNNHIAETRRVTAPKYFDTQLAPYLGYSKGAGGQYPITAENFFTHPREESAPRIAGAPRRSYAQNNRYNGSADDRALSESNDLGKIASRLPNPSRTMIYTERTGPGNPGGCVGQTSFIGIFAANHDPALMAASTDWSTEPNGPSGVFNYCFIDGHVETRRFDDPRMIGAGNSATPAGAWTATDGD